MAIGRRSFLASIGAVLAAPFTARALVPEPVEWPSTGLQANFFRKFYQGVPVRRVDWLLSRGDPLGPRIDLEEWRKVVREYSIKPED